MKNKNIFIRLSEKEKTTIVAFALKENRSISNFMLWLVSKFKKKEFTK